MRSKLLALALAVTLLATVATGAGAQPNVTTTEVTKNGAAGLVAAAVAALNNITISDTTIDIAVVELNNSFNNFNALNNILNNNDVDVTVQDIDVLTDNQIDILRNANVDLDAIVGVAVLGANNFLVFTRQQQ